MAVISKKDKQIEEAQKLALRGLFDKAAKIYEQILTSEPGAINLRQKLAELLIKSGRTDDARKEFETIGKHFSKNGFFLKAIAVYKQLQKLFPTDISLSLTLAELNEKHGLVANALTEYKQVYEYYEKAGNVTEALAILDKMQNVDPLNIAIKIKLAEAYHQQGKTKEAYTIFTKTASLLLERNDNTTLSKICSRIKQIFPNKPDFMFETLTELVNQGNAASAIDGIQNLLRTDPNNKLAWDLVAQAYIALEQPQRLKLAYQHYLKFFPSEPAAMHGLIASVTAEQNLAGALELLDKYESALIVAGYVEQLNLTYQALDKLDPINVRVTEGLIRIATAAGNEREIKAHTSKLKSLRSVSVVDDRIESVPELSPVFEGLPFTTDDSPASFFEDAAQEDSTPYALESSSEVIEDLEPVIAEVELLEQLDEEIEVEIDLDSPFAESESANTTPDNDSWLASVGNLFDSIDATPRGVKFGNEMDSSDAQSHFDLGQAFKEMGLFDEAINEFRQASQDPLRRVECLIMQCICLRERGEPEKAITILQTLLKSGLCEDENCSVKYELATAYETAGRTEEANVLLNDINTTNPDFRDIRSRIDAANLSESLDFSDEDLDDFGMK